MPVFRSLEEDPEGAANGVDVKVPLLPEFGMLVIGDPEVTHHPNIGNAESDPHLVSPFITAPLAEIVGRRGYSEEGVADYGGIQVDHLIRYFLGLHIEYGPVELVKIHPISVFSKIAVTRPQAKGRPELEAARQLGDRFVAELLILHLHILRIDTPSRHYIESECF